MFLKQKMKVSDVPLSQLSYSFLVDFELFVRNYKPLDHHKPCGHDTVLKHIEGLRKISTSQSGMNGLSEIPLQNFEHDSYATIASF